MRSLLLVGLLLVVVPSAAAAQDEAEPVLFDLTAGTHVPISVGAEGQLELPARILLNLHLGFTPAAYVDVINATATEFGWYSGATADLIAAAIDRAFVLRVGAGWRPFEHEGLELLAGYTLVLGGGSVTSAEAIEAGTGLQVSSSSSSGIPISTTLHGFHVRVSWRWILQEHWVIRASIGYVHTLAASTSINEEGATRPAVNAAERYLNNVLETYGLTPELQLMAGYRF